MVSQKNPSLKTKESMLSEMIGESKGTLDVIKKIILKGIVW